jgi:pimeloyl-ACP methyl ester carboxylesterase
MELLNRPDTQLAYVVQGAGDSDVLLLHGMCCDHSHMQGLADHLAPAHRVISADLRGHGLSQPTSPDCPFDIEAMCGDIDAMFDHIGVERALLIGHSLGGTILLGYANRRTERARGLIMLDSGIRPLDAIIADHGKRADERESNAPTDPGEFFRSRLLEPTDGEELIESVVALMTTLPSDRATALTRELVMSFDSFEEALACTVPAANILASRPSFTKSQWLDELGPNWQIARTLGAGHFVQLVVPDQVAAMVDRFIALLPA